MADNDETVLGTDGDDTIDVSEGVRFVLGEAGDDTITGGTSRDIMRGGSGDDTIRGNEGDDVIRGDTGDDTIFGGDDNDLILGDTGNDTLYGDAGDDFLIGGAGDDSLTGGTGADTFVFEDGGGHDTITDFDADNDTIDLSLVSEAITFADLTFTALTDGTGTVITHSALGGSITVLGLDPTDFTADLFNLPDGTATSIEVDERTTVEPWADPMEGSPLSEIIMDGSNATRIVAMEGSDTVLAGEGDDRLEGGAGHDLLLGEEGNDTLDGGADDDDLWGGSGDDTFVFQPGHGNDTIKDFTDGEDMIDLSAFTDITAFSDLTIFADGSASVIDLTSQGGGRIRLDNVAVSDLDADDFVLHDASMDGDSM